MITVYKYPLAVTDRQTVDMPVESSILAVQTQGGRPQMWAAVNTETPTKTRVIVTYGTGHEMTDPPGNMYYLGNYQIHDCGLVFHVFEVKP